MSNEINPSSILRLKAVCALTGLSRSTLWRQCRRGEFPQPLKLTARLIGWRAGEVHQWLDSRERGAPAVTEAKAELSESSRDSRGRAPHRRKKPCARKRRSPQAGDSTSGGVRERRTARGANGTLHGVSSAGGAAAVGAEQSRETEGEAR
jgi:prophage regulatory protein